MAVILSSTEKKVTQFFLSSLEEDICQVDDWVYVYVVADIIIVITFLTYVNYKLYSMRRSVNMAERYLKELNCSLKSFSLDDEEWPSLPKGSKTENNQAADAPATVPQLLVVKNSDLKATGPQTRSKKEKLHDFGIFLKPILERLDNLTPLELFEECKSTKLSVIGPPRKLRSQLKQFYKKYCELVFAKMSWIPPHLIHTYSYPIYQGFQYFDYLVVIDFEATCHQGNPPNFINEIIQFPAVLINTQSRRVIDEFNIFVKPKLNPTLSAFCTQLTGITQELVDNAPEFSEALVLFEKWLCQHQLGRYRFAVVCDGSWDMGKFMHTQCEVSKIPYPPYVNRWVNLRKSFTGHYNVKWFNLRVVLSFLGQPFIGRPHDGLDDSRNIGNIVMRLINDGCIIMENERILLGKVDQDRNALIQQQERNLYSLCTVENLSKTAFIKMYNKTAFPWNYPEMERIPNKENLASAKISTRMIEGSGSRTNNKKRTKSKFRKLVELSTAPNPTEIETVPSKTSSSEMLVVSAKDLE